MNKYFLDVAGQGRGTAPLTESITVGDTGVVTASRKCSGEVVHDLAGRATGSQISLIERLIPKTLPDADFCHCGQPAVHACPCGKEVCVAHLYDGEGRHVETQGFCCDCVDLIQAEQRGIERCGRAEAR